MTTTSDLIERTRAELQGNQLEELNELAADLTVTDQTVTFKYESKSVDRGKQITVGLENMYVWDFTPGSQPSCTVRRGAGMSVAGVHVTGDIVRVNPRFPDVLLLKELNGVLRSLSSPLNGLYRVRTTDLTGSAPSVGYDLSGVSDMLGDPLGVQYDTSGPSNDWPYLQSWSLRRNQDQSDFSSGLALRVDDYVPQGRSVRVVYKSSFAELTSLTQDVLNVSGLPATAHDIPPLGAAARLMATYEARRSYIDSQPDTRRAQEVVAGSASRSAGVLNALFAKRVAEEKARLQKINPDHKWSSS